MLGEILASCQEEGNSNLSWGEGDVGKMVRNVFRVYPRRIWKGVTRSVLQVVPLWRGTYCVLEGWSIHNVFEGAPTCLGGGVATLRLGVPTKY